MSSPPQPLAGVQTWPVLMGREFIHTASFPSSWSCTLQGMPLSHLLKHCETKPSASVCIQLYSVCILCVFIPHIELRDALEVYPAELPKVSVSSKNHLTQPWPGIFVSPWWIRVWLGRTELAVLRKTIVCYMLPSLCTGNTLGSL